MNQTIPLRLESASEGHAVAAEVRAEAIGLPPEGTRPTVVRWGYAASIVVMHLLSLLVFWPWLFSWTGVALLVAGHYVFGLLGMTLGYHRLLTHRAFSCPKWFERILTTLGVCCLQDSPARWVAVHRKHHQHSDEQPDPHSPLVAFIWGHLGWLLVENRDTGTATFYDRYARDVLNDSFYMWIERRLMWFWMYVAQAAMFFTAGLAIGWWMTGRYLGGLQFGASVLVWGVLARTVLVWHVTWSVNSLTHVCGYRNYQTQDNSRNNWLVALLAHGEGWHNNHHAQQNAAAHGHRWWEWDLTYRTICALEKIGLAKNVLRPPNGQTGSKGPPRN
jgi:fatty-acid desaturase